jgi:hypothetical protein
MSDASTAVSVTLRRLVWAIPAAYAVHVLDEARGDFPAWASSLFGGAVDGPVFALSSAFFLATALALSAWVSVTGAPFVVFLLMAWTFSHLFWDSFFHLSVTLAQHRDAPGLISALFLNLPLSVLVFAVVVRERRLSWRMMLLAALLGALTLKAAHLIGGAIQPFNGARAVTLTAQTALAPAAATRP